MKNSVKAALLVALLLIGGVAVNVITDAPESLGQPQEENQEEPPQCVIVWGHVVCGSGGGYPTCSELNCSQYDNHAAGVCYICIDGGTADARCEDWICPN